MVERFNSSDHPSKLFLLSSKSGGTGLNLIGASRLVLFDVDWNPANDQQAMARIWRDGQKSRVVIYRLISTGCIDEKVLQRGMWKQMLSNYVMDGKGDKADKFSVEDLRNIFKFDEEGACETHELLLCRCCGQPWNIENHQTTADVTNDENEPKKRKLIKQKVPKVSDMAKSLQSSEWVSEWAHIDPAFTDGDEGDIYLQSIDDCLRDVIATTGSLVSYLMLKKTNQ